MFTPLQIPKFFLGWSQYAIAWFFFKIFSAIKNDDSKPFRGWTEEFLKRVL